MIDTPVLTRVEISQNGHSMGDQLKTIKNTLSKFVTICEEVVDGTEEATATTKSRLDWYKKCLNRCYELEATKVKSQHLVLFGNLVKRMEPELLKFTKGGDDRWILDHGYEIVYGSNTGHPTAKIAIEISTIYRLAKKTSTDLQEDYLYAFFNVLCCVPGLSDSLDAHLNALVIEYEPPDTPPESPAPAPSASSTDTAGRLMEGADQLTSVLNNPDVMRQVESLITGVFNNPQLRGLAQSLQGQMGPGQNPPQPPQPPQPLTLIEDDEPPLLEKEEKH